MFTCEKGKDNNPQNTEEEYQFEEPIISGNTFYIDPVNGAASGDGSKEKPWRTLQEVFENNFITFYRHIENYDPQSELEIVNKEAPVKGGDRLILLSGYHGYIYISNCIMKKWLTIEAGAGETPVFSQIKFIGAFQKLYFKNLTILKDSYEGTENYWEADDVNRNSDACVYLGSNDFWGEGSRAKLYGLTLKTTTDVSTWGIDDWNLKAASGISLRAVKYIEVVNCHIENVNFGISVDYGSNQCKVVNNSVINFCGDGSRVCSNDVLFAYNIIKGCMKVNDNHDDGIQSFSRGEDNSAGTGVVKNVIIRGNIIISIIDKDNPLNGSLQGIGCFDGMFDNWIVENNVIISNTYHGISFYGMTNSKIANNTVIDQVAGDDVSPWIMITNHKNGTESANCSVFNNIASSSVSIKGNNVTETNNYVIGKANFDSLYTIFQNPDDNDLHLNNNELNRTKIIDKGIYFKELISSEFDIEMKLRSDYPDLGAYEY